MIKNVRDLKLSGEYFSSLLSSLDLKLFPELWDEQDNDAQALLAQMSHVPGCRKAEPELDERTLENLNELKTQLTERARELQLNSVEKGNLTTLDWVRSVFKLNRIEFNMFLVCAAPEADPRYQRIYSHLQNNGKTTVTADLLLRLCVPDGIERLAYLPLLQGGRALVDDLLLERLPAKGEPEINSAYCLADGMIECLSGVWRSDIYDGQAEFIQYPVEEQGVPVLPFPDEKDAVNDPMLISVYGPDLRVQEIAARGLAERMELPLLRLDMPAGADSARIVRLLRYALRDALLLDALLLVNGLDEYILADGTFPVELEAPIMRGRAVVVINTKREFIFSPNSKAPHRVMMRVPFEKLSGSQRMEVWRSQLAKQTGELSFPGEKALRQLSGQFVLNSAQISSAVAAARGFALSAGRKIELADLYRGARMCSMHHLDDLATKMPPRYDRNDLYLPQAQQEQLDELIAMVRNRSLVLEEWGVGKKLTSGNGIAVLFTGPPGTGKTLSGQVIAGELGLDLYRIDLSSVVSKYIGETEKNLEKIFSEAQDSNVILFFDEADALFGKRSEVSDAHDRYANIEVGYLLQRIETYDGLAILATNLGTNLDEAFTRRLHFIIDFPFPDEETRLHLWRMLIPANIQQDADLGLERLAREYRIAGGNIRNAIVSGIYRAAAEGHALCNDDLTHGVRSEFQKMGRVYKDA